MMYRTLFVCPVSPKVYTYPFFFSYFFVNFFFYLKHASYMASMIKGNISFRVSLPETDEKYIFSSSGKYNIKYFTVI